MNEQKFSETISYLSMTFSLSQIILECFKFKLWNFGFIFNNSNIEKNRFLLWRASHKRETKFVCGFPFLWYSLNSGPPEGIGTWGLVPTMFWKLYTGGPLLTRFFQTVEKQLCKQKTVQAEEWFSTKWTNKGTKINRVI